LLSFSRVISKRDETPNAVAVGVNIADMIHPPKVPAESRAATMTR
jgi:hypothetical protein